MSFSIVEATMYVVNELPSFVLAEKFVVAVDINVYLGYILCLLC